MITHLLLDADGVLQARDDEGAVLGRIGDVLGLDDAGARRFFEEALEAERPCLAGRARWAQVLPDLLEQWGRREHGDEVLDLWCDTRVRATVLAFALRAREQGVRCWVASNQDEHRAGVMEERFGYRRLLDGSFYSYDLGAAKPDAAFFSRLLDRLGADPSTVAFVDDRADNTEAAGGLGIASVCWTWTEGVATLTSRLRGLGVPL